LAGPKAIGARKDGAHQTAFCVFAADDLCIITCIMPQLCLPLAHVLFFHATWCSRAVQSSNQSQATEKLLNNLPAAGNYCCFLSLKSLTGCNKMA